MGFMDRYEQLKLMSQSIAVIQPSLFEGWSTVVEDAKALGKRAIISDINVHLEQQNEDTTIFPANDFVKLSKILMEIQQKSKSIVFQNKKTRLNNQVIKRAEKYGELFYKLLND
jgi:hypothetical protein